MQLKNVYPLVINGVSNMINFINREINKSATKAFNARDITARFSCDVTSSCVFAFDANSFSSEKSEIFELGQNIFKGISDSVQSMFPKKMIPRKDENEFIRIMTSAINHRTKNNSSHDDFLSHIIAVKQKKGQNDVEAAAHGWTLFLDSFETSAIVAHHALYEIANDQRVQEKLREEIMENLNDDGVLLFEKLAELSYLDQTFYEILRLHPPFMFTTKVCSEEIELEGIKGHKFMMKKGSTAMISIHSIHLDPGEILRKFL